MDKSWGIMMWNIIVNYLLRCVRRDGISTWTFGSTPCEGSCLCKFSLVSTVVCSCALRSRTQLAAVQCSAFDSSLRSTANPRMSLPIKPSHIAGDSQEVQLNRWALTYVTEAVDALARESVQDKEHCTEVECDGCACSILLEHFVIGTLVGKFRKY